MAQWAGGGRHRLLTLLDWKKKKERTLTEKWRLQTQKIELEKAMGFTMRH